MESSNQVPEQFFESSPGWSVGAVGSVVLMLWLDHPRAEGLDALDRALRRMQRTRGHSSLLTVVDGGLAVRPLDSLTRKRTVDVLRKHQNHLVRSAIVAGSDAGIWGSLLRSTITALDLVIRPKYDNRVFASIPRAAAWLTSTDDCGAVWQDVVGAVSSVLDVSAKTSPDAEGSEVTHR